MACLQPVKRPVGFLASVFGGAQLLLARRALCFELRQAALGALRLCFKGGGRLFGAGEGCLGGGHFMFGGQARALLLRLLVLQRCAALSVLPQPASEIGALLLAQRQRAPRFFLGCDQTAAFLLSPLDFRLDRFDGVLA